MTLTGGSAVDFGGGLGIQNLLGTIEVDELRAARPLGAVDHAGYVAHSHVKAAAAVRSLTLTGP